MSYHKKRFPNESSAYREARDKLLAYEISLRERVEVLGEMRRALPLGGKLKEDYVFEGMDASGAITPVRFSELFADKDVLFVYSYMYSEQMPNPCPACTSFIDGMNGLNYHILDRMSMVFVAKSPIERTMAVATSRNWQTLRFLSSAANSYNADYFGENDQGTQIPAANIFTRNAEGIFHFYNAELLYADLEGHPRHIDSIWPIWNLLDMTPEGRDADWFPRLSYD